MVIFKTADVGDIFFIFIRNSKRRLIEHSCSLVFFRWLLDHVIYLKLRKNNSWQSWENTQNGNYFQSNSVWVVILKICLQTVISLLVWYELRDPTVDCRILNDMNVHHHLILVVVLLSLHYTKRIWIGYVMVDPDLFGDVRKSNFTWN